MRRITLAAIGIITLVVLLIFKNQCFAAGLNSCLSVYFVCQRLILQAFLNYDFFGQFSIFLLPRTLCGGFLFDLPGIVLISKPDFTSREINGKQPDTLESQECLSLYPSCPKCFIVGWPDLKISLAFSTEEVKVIGWSKN